MATKPTERILEAWASGGSATDPGAGKEATGWVVSERPPAEWFNYLLKSAFKWIGWSEDSIDALEAGALYRSASASDALRTMASSLLFDIADDSVARIIEAGALPTNDGRLLFHSGDLRIYHHKDALGDNIYFTSQAEINNTTGDWVADGASPRAAFFSLATGIAGMANGITSGTWNVSWTTKSEVSTRVLARIETTTATTPPVIEETSGAIGISSIDASSSPTTGQLTVNFTHTFPDVYYNIQITPLYNGDTHIFHVESITTTSVGLRVTNDAGGFVNLTTADIGFYIHAIG